MKRRLGLMTMNTLKLNGEHSHYLNTSESAGVKRGKFQPYDPKQPAVLRTKIWIEGWHGVMYGGGIGLLLGLYVLFFPLWMTVSPAWYTYTQWYVIMAITILSCMTILGLGAAVLGSNIINRERKPQQPAIPGG